MTAQTATATHTTTNGTNGAGPQGAAAAPGRIPAAMDDTGTTWLPNSVIKAQIDRGEHGAATVLAELYKGRILFDHAEKAWHLWGGDYWLKDVTGEVVNLVANNLSGQYLYAAAGERQAGNAGADKIANFAKQLCNRKTINNVLALAAGLPGVAIDGSQWDTHPMKLAVLNGVIDLATGKLNPGYPSEFIRTVAPIKWDSLTAQSKTWDKFLLDCHGNNKSVVDYLNRLLGYSITGLDNTHVLPIFSGEHGRNGKGTLFRVLGAILGPMIAPVTKDVLITHKAAAAGAPAPHLYALRGLRIAWLDETKQGEKLNIDQVKRLTGGGVIKARTLHKDMVEFRQTHTMFLITNAKPVPDADDNALWSRVQVVEFEHEFIANPDPANPKQHKADIDLEAKLLAEAPAILAWLVRGCLAWKKEELNPPLEVKLAAEKYRAEHDTLASFVTDCLILTGDMKDAEMGNSLYMAYEAWARDNDKEPKSKKKFGVFLKTKFQSVRDSAGMKYLGVKIDPDARVF